MKLYNWKCRNVVRCGAGCSTYFQKVFFGKAFFLLPASGNLVWCCLRLHPCIDTDSPKQRNTSRIWVRNQSRAWPRVWRAMICYASTLLSRLMQACAFQKPHTKCHTEHLQSWQCTLLRGSSPSSHAHPCPFRPNRYVDEHAWHFSLPGQTRHIHHS